MQKGPNRLTWHLLDCPCYSAILSARLDTNPPESSGMKARHASESKKAKEGDDPADSKAEQGDTRCRGSWGPERLLRRGVREGGHQPIVTMVLNTVKSRQRKRRS